MNELMSSSDNEPATRGDLRLLKGDVSLLKGEFQVFRSEIRSDFSTFRQELREEIRDLIRPITITLAHHTAKLADIRGHIKDKMVTRDEFHSRMDGFTGRVVDSDYLTAKNRELIDDHTKRIKALEDKTAQA